MQTEQTTTTTETTDPIEQAISKAAEKAGLLSAQMGAKIHPLVFFADGDENRTDPIVGFLKEPLRVAKIRIMDKAGSIGELSAAEELLQICIIKEESDPRIYSENQQYDDIFIGAVMAANNVIRVAINQYKKK